MADRFPSLEEFDSGVQTEIKDVDIGDIPSASNFLEREKAILGEEANRFATVEDAAAIDAGDDLLGGGDVSMASPGATAQFESQFPDISAAEAAAPTNVTITGGPSIVYNSGFTTTVEDEEEPEVIREWRAKRDEQIRAREEVFARQREATIAEAQRNIDEFYENYNNKKEKLIAQTRREAEEFLAKREDTTSGGTSWERIAKLVDISGKGAKGGATGSGKERFRELLISLRKDENAPGASGY
ncbi:putative clathrin light chain protein [Thermochaetoides thermophila DSM 1495]|uniref:Clathrin light chain n=1 Tax=Chaetomium thermophilum (strain DSM 1495 / CBS 144.50 / IMI 039719) TaxID=759272 RepID=G0SGW5_CHATD|nr:putative clathrin light chain protein [Thermochaetoides thermophila DSM 1495]EGS17454.1 putative clathrin light chain protein [Thermochaetoides thermophila DSM 1495]